MKKFLIFLGILFSSCFLINSEVHAYYYTEDDVTYDYEFFKNLILEKQNINLDDYEYVIIQTDDFGSSTGIVFTILFWNNSDYKVSSLNEKGKKITLKNFDDAYFVAYYPHSWQGFNFFNLKDKSSSSSWQEDGKNKGFSVYHDTWVNENGTLTRYKSSTKNLDYIEFEGVKYYFDNFSSSGSKYNVNFHLNNGIAVDYYQSDIEEKEIINKVKSILGIDKILQDNPKLSGTMNDLFIDPNENKFSKFCSDWIIDVETQYEALQWYQKLINKEYAQPIYYYEDFTMNIKSDELEKRLKKITITKSNMSFRGLYYDSNYQNNVKENYIINSDVDLYAKYDYENVDDFLKDNTFKSYTFDENYAYAFISIGKNVGQDVYLGLDFLNYSIEIYKYDKTELKVNKGSSFCLTPYFSKDNKYYYRLETINDNYYNVLVLPREKLITEENGIFTTHYNFLLTDNATVTYTNDLKQAQIVDDSGNKITIDIEDSYNYSQQAFLNNTDDLLTIFKNLLKNKNNNVFQYFEQIWQFLKRSKIFIYLNILIIGALIILIIKAANRR